MGRRIKAGVKNLERDLQVRLRAWLAWLVAFRYLSRMELTVPDELIQTTNLTQDQLRFDLALGLYIDQRITLGRGAEIAGITKPVFLDELGKRKLPIHYDAEDLQADLETIAALQTKRAKQNL